MAANQLNLSVPAKVLVIRFSSIGDVVLTTPVVRCLKQQLEGPSEIHYLVKAPFEEVLKNNPYIDKLHVLNDNRDELIANLQAEGFDYVIDLHKNLRSLIFKRKLKVLSFTFPKLNIKKWILVNFKWDLLPDIHIVDRYFMAVKALGVENDRRGIDYFLGDEERVNTKDLFGLMPEEFVAFAIGGAHEGKKLPTQRIDELCGMIEHSIVLIGGPEDAELGAALESKYKHVSSACGKLSINGSASVIEQSRMVISHDSGMMHIASAFKKKIISIWGATVPKFGMYPYLPHPDSLMIQADHLKFRPTSKLGNKKSKKERRTTEEIDLQLICSAVERLW